MDDDTGDEDPRPPWAFVVGVLVAVAIGCAFLGAHWFGLWPTRAFYLR